MNKKLLALLLSGLLMGSVAVEASWKSSVIKGARNLTLAASMLVLKAKCTKDGLNLSGDAESALVCTLSLLLFLSGTDHLINACE